MAAALMPFAGRAQASIASLSQKIAGGGSEEARMAALHDHVRDEVKFGWASRFNRHDPEDTLRRGIGFCQTKSLLLSAMAEAAGVEARVVWCEIGAGVLRGLIDPGTPMLDHAYVEAKIDGEWIAFDSHIVDTPLFAGASRRLAEESASAGYGVHADGGTTFPDFVQFRGDLEGRVWGVFESAEDFEANAPKSWNRLPALVRLGFGLLAAPANARADALRA